MFLEFASCQDAVELIEIFYPAVAAEVRRNGTRRVSSRRPGDLPPRDFAFKVIVA